MKNKALCKQLGALVLGAFLLTNGAQAQVNPLDRVIAVVDNDVIMQSQLQARINDVVRNMQSRNISPLPQDVLVHQVLDRLVLESIQLQLAERHGVHVDDEEINAAMANIAQRNGLTPSQFTQAVAQQGLSIESIRNQIRTEMIINRVRQQAVGERIRVSDQEVKNFLASEMGRMQLSEEYRLANIVIPIRQGASGQALQNAQRQAADIYNQLKRGVDFTQLAISRSSGDSALEGGEIGWRKAAQLPPPFDQLVSSLKVGEVTEPVRSPSGFIIIKVLDKRGGSENPMRDEVHVRHILLKPNAVRTEVDTEKLAEKLYERIQSGEDFGQLARSFSEDPGSALHGGEMDWIDPEALVPEFRQMMDTTPIGQISKPFQTRYGWHVLEVLGRRAADNSAQEREAQAREALHNRKYDQELQTWLRQIRDEAYVEEKL